MEVQVILGVVMEEEEILAWNKIIVNNMKKFDLEAAKAADRNYLTTVKIYEELV